MPPTTRPAAMALMMWSTASANRWPRPGRCFSYQRTASMNSASASSWRKTGTASVTEDRRAAGHQPRQQPVPLPIPCQRAAVSPRRPTPRRDLQQLHRRPRCFAAGRRQARSALPLGARAHHGEGRERRRSLVHHSGVPSPSTTVSRTGARTRRQHRGGAVGSEAGFARAASRKPSRSTGVAPLPSTSQHTSDGTRRCKGERLGRSVRAINPRAIPHTG